MDGIETLHIVCHVNMREGKRAVGRYIRHNKHLGSVGAGRYAHADMICFQMQEVGQISRYREAIVVGRERIRSAQNFLPVIEAISVKIFQQKTGSNQRAGCHNFLPIDGFDGIGQAVRVIVAKRAYKQGVRLVASQNLQHHPFVGDHDSRIRVPSPRAPAMAKPNERGIAGLIGY